MHKDGFLHRQLKAMLFDLDGTLYVSTLLGREIRRSACRYLAKLKGVTVQEAEALVDETKKRLSAVSGTDTPLSLACRELGVDLRELHRHFAFEIDPAPFLVVDDRVVELLKSLGRRYELYIYTNNNIVLTAGIMRCIGIDGLFTRVFTIDDFWIPKPDHGSLAEVLRQIGRAPEECLFIGDRYDVDLRLPAAMGSGICLVNTTEDLFPLLQIKE